MKFIIQPSRLNGSVAIPPSKSHTIRAVFLGLLGEGESRIDNPLDSEDTRAAARAATALGADVSCEADRWLVRGNGPKPRFAARAVDLANSGTSLRILLGIGSLCGVGESLTVTGDAQLSARPAAALLDSLRDLGAAIDATGESQRPPLVLRGGLRGGETTIEAKTSQYVTSLMMACPFAEHDSRIVVTSLNEAPYLDITAEWLRTVGIDLDPGDYTDIRIPGGQTSRTFLRRIPADFSSATFFLAAGALGDNDIECRGLDPGDSQPDRKVLEHLAEMGAEVTTTNAGLRVTADRLRGCELDLNETPDALPMMAVAACLADGETVLKNVPHARIKETDRIAAMTCELRKMRANVRELPDGLVVQGGALHGADVDGHGDHRVVMALAVAGLHANGTTTVSTAQAANVTFPEFADRIRALGGTIEQDGDD